MTKHSKSVEHQLEKRGISPQEIERQVELFERGVDSARLDRACVIGDGILGPSAEDVAAYINTFEKSASESRVVKFVPASGAASRMFKHLHTQDPADPLYQEFTQNLTRFPFFLPLSRELERTGKNIQDLIEAADWDAIVAHIMRLPGLDYGRAPKGMVHFHDYGEEQRTAFEEQLVESVQYAMGKGGSKVHFTIPSNDDQGIEAFIEGRLHHLGLQDLTVSYSIQAPFSDTVAVDEENRLVTEKDRQLVFRPGGHGALIHNLNDIEADLIFIKNIDNVAPDRLRQDTVSSKKLLAGLAVQLTRSRNELLEEGDSEKASAFIRTYFDPHFEGSFEDAYKLLDRPLRVCGMVKNTGEPGGGPFWVKTDRGVTCQIIEKAQIDLEDPEQHEILSQSTHFNPVDVVCSVISPEGTKYNLLDFVDHDSSFISEKSFEGKTIKALELPGLWNGAMAFWNTVFVEVPISTFSPVKTVNDLLRPEHQAIVR